MKDKKLREYLGIRSCGSKLYQWDAPPWEKLLDRIRSLESHLDLHYEDSVNYTKAHRKLTAKEKQSREDLKDF